MQFKIIFFCLCIFCSCHLKAKDTVNIRLYGDVKSLDWHFVLGHRARWVMDNILVGLVKIDDKNEVAPDIAQSWKISQNNKVYTFTLRKDIKWSDGKSLTSDDFIFAWEKLLQPKSATNFSSQLEEIEGVLDFNTGRIKDFNKVGMKALDAWTIQIKLKRSYANWHRAMAGLPTFPMRRDVVTKFGNKWTDPENIVTNGPYKVAARILGQKITLIRNPYYHGEQAKVEKVEALVIENELTAIKLFNAGELDVAQMVSDKAYKGQVPEAHVVSSEGIGIVGLGMVATDAEMKNRHLRRAIAHAIDRSIFAKIFGTNATPATRLIPKFIAGSQAIGPQFDLVKAKEELKKSKFDLTKRLTIDIGNSGDQKLTAEVIQNQLKVNLGLTVDINMMELNMAHQRRVEQKGQMFMSSQASNSLTRYGYLKIYDGASNFSGYENKEFTRLVESTVNMSEKKKIKILEKAEQILLEDAPSLPLYFTSLVTLVSPRIKNYQSSPIGIGKLHFLTIQ